VNTPTLSVRDARAADHAAIAALTVAAYVGGGFTPPASEYVAMLTDVAARAEAAELLVAVHGEVVVGSVALAVDGGPYAENAGPGEAVFRMLAVAPTARGLGAGERLVRACLERAVAAGRSRIVISTQPTMSAAHRLYQRLGFIRNPDGDWSPRPGVALWSYTRELTDLPAWCPHCGRDERTGAHGACSAALALEPPRYCRACGRRLVVQVTPRDWQATCSRHGARRSPVGSGHEA
jgi:ribosomal protein S18 acetylase RimI-like enzyme